MPSAAWVAERLPPPAPLWLRRIAKRAPRGPSECIVLEHHGVSAATTSVPEPLFSCQHQIAYDTLAPPVRPHSHAIEVTTPSVPAGNNGADDLVAGNRE